MLDACPARPLGWTLTSLSGPVSVTGSAGFLRTKLLFPSPKRGLGDQWRSVVVRETGRRLATRNLRYCLLRQRASPSAWSSQLRRHRRQALPRGSQGLAVCLVWSRLFVFPQKRQQDSISRGTTARIAGSGLVPRRSPLKWVRGRTDFSLATAEGFDPRRY